MSVVAFVSQWTVTAVPPDQRDTWGAVFDVEVCRAQQLDGSLKWAVRWRGQCLHRSGRWDWEPIPSSRTTRWLASHRFDEATAMKLAEKAAPRLTVNGYRPDGSRAA